MAAKSNLLNMVVVLGVTCLVCSGVLAGAYALTKDPIDAAAAEKTNQAIGEVLPHFTETAYEAVDLEGKTYHYYKATEGDKLIGYAVESSVVGFGGPLSLMVGVTADGVVYNTSVLSHSETPGLGGKIKDDPAFRAQFKGKSVDFNDSKAAFSIVKGGAPAGKANAIDAISGATMTSKGLDEAINVWLGAYKAYLTKTNPEE